MKIFIFSVIIFLSIPFSSILAEDDDLEPSYPVHKPRKRPSAGIDRPHKRSHKKYRVPSTQELIEGEAFLPAGDLERLAITPSDKREVDVPSINVNLESTPDSREAATGTLLKTHESIVQAKSVEPTAATSPPVTQPSESPVTAATTSTTAVPLTSLRPTETFSAVTPNRDFSLEKVKVLLSRGVDIVNNDIGLDEDGEKLKKRDIEPVEAIKNATDEADKKVYTWGKEIKVEFTVTPAPSSAWKLTAGILQSVLCFTLLLD